MYVVYNKPFKVYVSIWYCLRGGVNIFKCLVPQYNM